MMQMMRAVSAGGTIHSVTPATSQEPSAAAYPVHANSRKSIFSKFATAQTVCSETEDNQYCNSATESDVLPEVYWSKMSSIYPRLSKLARTLLSIPASSGSVERLFSVSGAIVRARRSRLTAKTVESLLLTMEYENPLKPENNSETVI